MYLLAKTVSSFFYTVNMILIIRALMSWFIKDWSTPFPRFIRDITEPILMPMRSLFNRLGINNMGIDFSFLATVIALQYIGNAIVRIIFMFA